MRDFEKLCVRTEAPITQEIKDRLITHARLIHVGMGMQTEPGEWTDALKKHIFYGAPLDVTNMMEEVGDTLWYIGLFCNIIGVTLEDLQALVIHKLQMRYPEKFTQTDALNRNLDEERALLESQSKKG